MFSLSLPYLPRVCAHTQAQAQEAIEQMRAKSEVEWKQRVELVREELRSSLSQALADKEASNVEARRYKVGGAGVRRY